MQQEGVIKFQLDFTPAPAVADVGELNAWRDWLYERELLGQDPLRYEGYGFGNVSRRLTPAEMPPGASPEARAFVISGTQTGSLAHLGPEHYAVVLACFPAENRVVAEGPIQPSSESMTHGTIYAVDAAIRFVMHVHSPEIWRHADALGLPTTRADVPYGSPAMADEVRRLFAETDVAAQRIFAMAGHEDGVVSFGVTAREAAEPIRRCFDLLHLDPVPA